MVDIDWFAVTFALCSLESANGFQPNTYDSAEIRSFGGAELVPESNDSINSSASFNPVVHTGFQPTGHSLFEPAAPKKERKYASTAVKSIPRGVAERTKKLPSISEAFAHSFVGDKLAGRASSVATQYSPEAGEAKNSCAGFQPSVHIGFQPKEHSLVEQARIKKRRRLAENKEMKRLADRRYRARPEVKERRRLAEQRHRARPQVK